MPTVILVKTSVVIGGPRWAAHRYHMRGQMSLSPQFLRHLVPVAGGMQNCSRGFSPRQNSALKVDHRPAWAEDSTAAVCPYGGAARSTLHPALACFMHGPAVSQGLPSGAQTGRSHSEAGRHSGLMASTTHGPQRRFPPSRVARTQPWPIGPLGTSTY